jgi:hypothetical protein
MANTQPYEILAGPLSVYYAPTETPFPGADESDETIIDGGTWTPIGFTEGGIKVAHPQTVVELRADQVTGVVKAVRSEEGLEITFDIASLTLENYALALNQALTGPLAHNDTGGVAHAKSLKMYRGGFQVETFALLCRQGHLSPYGDFPLSFEVPVVFEAGSPEDTHSKDNKAVLAVSLHAMVDPNRDDDSESFGRLNAGDGS